MRSRDEIFGDLRKQAKIASASEKEALRKLLGRLIEDRMRLINDSAKHAVAGLTPLYRRAFQDMIENDRIWLSELEGIKQELDSN